MDLRQLKYFIAVAEERNIGRAATRLHLSQPPLTRHIQALEEELGVQLFTRHTWGVALTQAGEALLDHARDIRALVDVATENAQRAAKGLLGRLDIGVYGSAMLAVVPRVLDAFSRTHPEVELNLHNAPIGRQIEALHQGRILLAFDRHTPDTPDLETELVAREPLLIALNTRNPLSQQAAVHVTALEGASIIGEQVPTVFNALQPLLLHHAVQLKVAQHAADLISAVVMVAGGFGSAVVPASMQTLQLPNLVYRPLLGDIECLINVHCIYRRGDQSPLLREVLDTVRACRDDSSEA
jgi:DNA-binding transcriptional LysR family regulator